MERFRKKIEFSLDCELLWGMRKGVPGSYIQNHVLKSEFTLKKIIQDWHPKAPNIYLAFVAKTLVNFDIDSDDYAYFSSMGYGKYLNSNYLKYETIEFNYKQTNILLGLHGVNHRFYTDLNEKEKNKEISSILTFIEKNNNFSSMFVYPKNLADTASIDKYKIKFSKIRVNSCSWLYRTTGKVSRLKRILRYLDSFLPIFELFCNKTAEHNIDNAVVGTHFFRANLPKVLLMLHYYRLKFGCILMPVLGKKIHIWSHPHNFAGNSYAIKLFCRLGNQ